MTIASLVRKTLALKNHRVVTVAEEASKIVISLDLVRRRLLPCSGCGTFGKVRDRLPERGWRHVPLWGIPVEFRYRPARIACELCGPRVEVIPWSTGKSPITRELAVTIAAWSRTLAWEVVGRLFSVSWATVVGAVSWAVEWGLARRDLSGVRILGIDEISRRRGHIYHTNVYDLTDPTRRRLIWSGEGREKATLQRFFAEIGTDLGKRIQAVCCDMWANYVEVVRSCAANAAIVFDKFHLVRHLLNAVNDVRKAEAKELKGSDPEILKGTRYIWLKNPENLTDRQRVRLSELEKMNLKVNRAYLLKELFRDLWGYQKKGWAKRYLDQWFWWATHSRLAPMREFAWMLRRNEDGILAYFDHRIDNGAVEAMNNNAKAISHRARGFRSAKAFTLAMLHCLGRLELPEIAHKFS